VRGDGGSEPTRNGGAGQPPRTGGTTTPTAAPALTRTTNAARGRRPRYGADIKRRREHARAVHRRSGYPRHAEVEVSRRRARDYVTWRNERPEGVEIINGVRVRRFPVRRERTPIDFGRPLRGCSNGRTRSPTRSHGSRARAGKSCAGRLPGEGRFLDRFRDPSSATGTTTRGTQPRLNSARSSCRPPSATGRRALDLRPDVPASARSCTTRTRSAR